MALEIGIDPIILLVSGLLLGAVLTAALAAKAGSRFRVPGALLFLVLGMVVGDDGLGWVSLSDTTLVRDLGIAALLLILFEGGLTTKTTDLRIAAAPGIALATLGVLVTAAITATGAWLLLDLDVATAALLGSVIASTDAAAVFSMMRTTPLPRRVSAVLRIESGANDPIAVMLTVGLVTTIIDGPAGPGSWALFALVQLAGGLAVGAAVGMAGVWLLRRVHLGVQGLYPIMAAAIAGVAYGVAAVLGASGFVAVYLAGLLIGAFVPRHRHSILGFHEAMANAAEIGLFLLLGLLVFPSRLPAVTLAALAVSVILVLVARPAAVWLCTMRTGFGWRERVVVSWAGLRGAVPIVLATLPLTAGVPGSGALFDVVFFVVLLSVLLQGTSLQWLVERLGVAERRPAWAPVAEALPLDDVDVDLIELTIDENLAVVDRTLQEIGPPGAGRAVALVRDERVLVPTGATRLQAGDVLLLACVRDDTNDMARLVTAWARGEPRGGAATSVARGEDDPDR